VAMPLPPLRGTLVCLVFLLLPARVSGDEEVASAELEEDVISESQLSMSLPSSQASLFGANARSSTGALSSYDALDVSLDSDMTVDGPPAPSSGPSTGPPTTTTQPAASTTTTFRSSSSTSTATEEGPPPEVAQVRGSLSLDFTSGSAADFVDAFANDTNGSIGRALAEAIAAPLAGVSPSDVTILGVTLAGENGRRLRLRSTAPALYTRHLQSSGGVLIEYVIELVGAVAARSQEVVSELESATAAVAIVSNLNAGVIAESFTIGAVEVAAEVVPPDTTTLLPTEPTTPTTSDDEVPPPDVKGAASKLSLAVLWTAVVLALSCMGATAA